MTHTVAMPDVGDYRNLQRQVCGEGWEYSDADTQELTHGLHRYSGKFIPQVAARAIKLISRPGDLVLDPYCGSGTTLLEAICLGRKAIGIDLNPLAVLIASAKITPIPSTDLENALQQMREAVDACELDAVPRLWGQSCFQRSLLRDAARDPRSRDTLMRKWFQPQVLSDLVILKTAIEQLEDRRVHALALAAFSEILRRSSNAHSSYPNVMYDRNAPTKPKPGALFLRKFQDFKSKVDSLSTADAQWSDVRVLQGDATDLPIKDTSIDAVVTHPPYIGSIPYAEYGLLSLLWLGADPKELDRKLTGGRRQTKDVAERFRNGYREMLAECFRVLRPGRFIFVLVGHPTVAGQVINLEEMTLALARETGFDFAASTTRAGINRRANKMGKEAVLFFQKPMCMGSGRASGRAGTSIHPEV